MKWLILIIIMAYGTVSAAQESAPPYIYYYSSALGALVVERADGSDSRTLAEGLTPLAADKVSGPGWSPDGQWFAWYGIQSKDYGTFSTLKAMAVRVDNLTRLKSLDSFVGIEEMLWSPDSRYLFIRGRIGLDSAIRPTAFWLIEVAMDRLVASTDMFVYSMMYRTPLEWQVDQQQIILYLYEESFVKSTMVRVTLKFDGSVLKEPISAELYAVKSAYESPEIPFNQPLSSPSGHYVEHDNNGVLTDAVTKLNFNLPLHSDSAGLRPIDVRWHPAEVWALFGYQRCFTDCSEVGGVNVVNVVDGKSREISQCGFGQACVGWLPEAVDLSQLPKGQTRSVLPAPISYQFDVEYATGVESSDSNPLLTCDPATDKHFHILDAKTRATIFILKTRPDCESQWEPWPIAFALSPNGKLFAMTNAVYDVQTEEILARFNTYGWDLAFSSDGTQLSMRSVNARMTWDVQELLDTGKRMKLLTGYFQRQK